MNSKELSEKIADYCKQHGKNPYSKDGEQPWPDTPTYAVQAIIGRPLMMKISSQGKTHELSIPNAVHIIYDENSNFAYLWQNGFRDEVHRQLRFERGYSTITEFNLTGSYNTIHWPHKQGFVSAQRSLAQPVDGKVQQAYDEIKSGLLDILFAGVH